MSYIDITVQEGLRSAGSHIMTLVDDGQQITVLGDSAIAEEMRKRRNPPPILPKAQGYQRFAQFIGGDHFPIYWQISELHEGTPITASARLEFGDVEGHPFRGNQWTGSKGERSPEQLGRLAGSKRGGFTYNPLTSTSATKGWAVAMKGHEKVYKDSILKSSSARMDAIASYIAENRAVLVSNPDAYIGGWHDTDTHRLVLDVSVVHEDEALATSVGKENDQDAMYNLETGETRGLRT